MQTKEEVTNQERFKMGPNDLVRNARMSIKQRQKERFKMSEQVEKTCWNCKYREQDSSLEPCASCELHFNWKERTKE